MAMAPLGHSAARLRAEVEAARSHTDALFALVDAPTLYERPIAERHRLIFYLGHLDAFDWNLLARGVLDLPAFHATFDQLFQAGIDPAPGQAPEDRMQDWPGVNEVMDYVSCTRYRLDAEWDALPNERVQSALEHRWMHAETLCYLLHQLAPSQKRRPAGRTSPPVAGRSPMRPDWIALPGGTAVLGQRDGEFGWDNEFPRHAVTVAPFELARNKVTNAEYRRFVADSGPAAPFWRLQDGRWLLRRQFDCVPLPDSEPVYLTHEQATDYARWAGARLPTEAEWQLAAYGDADARPLPWGTSNPTPARANLDFHAWDPSPVSSHQDGRTPDGLEQMLGNGWEWTSTPFAAFPGFAPRPYYPGYSANFFDGEHFVLKGASPRTAARLARPSFRNWFRAAYPYAYTTVRLARSS
jgi:formylglycine-generating enzyme required for sulfatase activity